MVKIKKEENVEKVNDMEHEENIPDSIERPKLSWKQEQERKTSTVEQEIVEKPKKKRAPKTQKQLDSFREKCQAARIKKAEDKKKAELHFPPDMEAREVKKEVKKEG